MRLQRNAWHILRQCGMAMPPIVSVEQYLQNGPGFLFLFHPSLGVCGNMWAYACCLKVCVGMRMLP